MTPEREQLQTDFYEWSARFECKVCGNRPDRAGRIEHGRGCYTQSEDGGGMSYEKDGAFESFLLERLDAAERDRDEARRERDALLAWLIAKIKTVGEYYEPPTDGRDATHEIYGWMHVLCFHYVQNRREVKEFDAARRALKEERAAREKAEARVDTLERNIAGKCLYVMDEELQGLANALGLAQHPPSHVFEAAPRLIAAERAAREKAEGEAQTWKERLDEKAEDLRQCETRADFLKKRAEKAEGERDVARNLIPALEAGYYHTCRERAAAEAEASDWKARAEAASAREQAAHAEVAAMLKTAAEVAKELRDAEARYTELVSAVWGEPMPDETHESNVRMATEQEKTFRRRASIPRRAKARHGRDSPRVLGAAVAKVLGAATGGFRESDGQAAEDGRGRREEGGGSRGTD